MTHFDRNNPFFSCIRKRTLLSQKGSIKQTYHLTLSFQESSLTYQPGDCAAILPSNTRKDVDSIIQLLHLKEEENIDNQSLREFLTQKANLHKPHPALIRKFLGESLPDQSEFIKKSTPADLIALKRNALIPSQEIPRLFLPLLPRFYSIASSPLMFPREMHLLISLVHYQRDGQEHKGIASRFLCEDAIVEKTEIPLYIQPAHHFLLPEDPNAAIILVGAGTGLAPYRAFMQHRLATNAKGRSWLFLGERNRATNFYYQDFWEDLQKQNRLRLSLAFSRDSEEKIYVQHRMWEERRDLWSWIRDGAYFYVCGDAHHMAKEVEAALHRIAMSEGGLSTEEAHHFIKNLRTEKRYRMDVY